MRCGYSWSRRPAIPVVDLGLAPASAIVHDVHSTRQQLLERNGHPFDLLAFVIVSSSSLSTLLIQVKADEARGEFLCFCIEF